MPIAENLPLTVGFYDLTLQLEGDAPSIQRQALEEMLKTQFRRRDLRVLDWQHNRATNKAVIRLEITTGTESAPAPGSLEATWLVPVVITALAILAAMVTAYLIVGKVESIVQLVPDTAQIGAGVGFGALGIAALVAALAVFGRPILEIVRDILTPSRTPSAERG